MSNTVKVLDKQQNLIVDMNAKRALYLATAYHTRFRIQDIHELRKELDNMARLAQKYPVKYQQKLTLEDVKDEELTLVSLEQKEGTSGAYYLMRVERADKSTGYISMGFAPICDALAQVNPKKDLPAEIKFVKNGASWMLV